MTSRKRKIFWLGFTWYQDLAEWGNYLHKQNKFLNNLFMIMGSNPNLILTLNYQHKFKQLINQIYFNLKLFGITLKRK